MESPKKYFQDKLVLLLVSSNIFLAFLAIALIFLRLGQGGGQSFIIEYRSNLGISAFTNGGLLDILTFAIFAVVVASFCIALSMRTYNVRRLLSTTVLGAGLVLLALTIIVSNALLVLR